MPRIEASGARIPALGLNTWRLTGETRRRLVETALAAGYRHIATAHAYDNEDAVGRGLLASGVPREEVWLTTKVWPDNYPADRFLPSVERSLERLGVGHWLDP